MYKSTIICSYNALSKIFLGSALFKKEVVNDIGDDFKLTLKCKTMKLECLLSVLTYQNVFPAAHIFTINFSSTFIFKLINIKQEL